MKLNPEVFRRAANDYLWDGLGTKRGVQLARRSEFCCIAILNSWIIVHLNCVNYENVPQSEEYEYFFEKHFRPKEKREVRGGYWSLCDFGGDPIALQAHRYRKLIEAANLCEKLNKETP